jgi:two-component system chemotaxis response regulator CheY
MKTTNFLRSKPSILVVEDDADLMEVLVELLRSLETFGSIIQASNGKEALLKITNQKFDIVLTDLNIPKHDGLELAASIKRVKSGEGTYIILMSGSLTEEAIRRSREVGIFAVMVKPFSLSRFKESLRKIRQEKLKSTL